MSDIEQAVYEALGAASVCWTDEGVFDSEQAKSIGEDLMYQIVQEVEQARADERARVLGALDGPARESEAMYAHAESIAARLVEVICEDAESEAWIEDSNQQLQEQITGLIQTGYALRRDLKQALAELAEVRERIAQEIEAFHAAECGPPESPWPHVCTCATAAAIARGEQS